ncbi:MAG: FHA domain-containing protein [Rhodothermales bacterium]|nr:FHA domain-containing protein [Rhodothermales bacterium]
MPALLYCRTGPLSGASFSLDAETSIGRTSENGVTLSDERISGHHARIWPDPESGAWMLEDLESSNGTRVDGHPADGPVQLGDLSVVTFAGRFDFIFQVTDAASVPESSPPPVQPAQPAPTRTTPSSPAQGDDIATRAGGAPPALPDTSAPVEDDGIRTKVGGAAPSLPDVDPGIHTRVGAETPDLPDIPSTTSTPSDDDIHTRVGGAPPSLPDLSTGAEQASSDADASAPDAETVGPSAPKAPSAGSPVLHVRSSESDVQEFELGAGETVVGRSADADIRIDDASLSRRHAVLTVSGSRVTVRDNDSKNGTWIDGEKVSGDRVLTPGSRLRFGFRVEAWLSEDIA